MLTLNKTSRDPVQVSLDVFIEATPWQEVYRAVVVDITSSRQWELAQRQTEARLKLAVSAETIGIWQRDLDSREIYLSGECCEVFGLDEFCTTIEKIERLLHPDDAGQALTLFRGIPDNLAARSLEYRIVRPGNKVAWIHSVTETLFDLNNEAVAVVGTAKDITASKQRT